MQVLWNYMKSRPGEFLPGIPFLFPFCSKSSEYLSFIVIYISYNKKYKEDHKEDIIIFFSMFTVICSYCQPNCQACSASSFLLTERSWADKAKKDTLTWSWYINIIIAVIMYYTSTVFFIQGSIVKKKERTWVVYFAYEDQIFMSQIQDVLAK